LEEGGNQNGKKAKKALEKEEGDCHLWITKLISSQNHGFFIEGK
jgi:hypothetical protein